MINGFLNVYKPKDWTSHDVVAKLRGIFKQKRIGHMGTLDPMAKGVLPICLGYATKAQNYIETNNKIYKVSLKLGIETDTYDITGKIISQKEVNLESKVILEEIYKFKGVIDQYPPIYSAIKYNGKKLYEFARKGENIDLQSRKIEIYDIYDVKIEGNIIELTVSCSKGTYIRSLCHDIGQNLCVGATMIELERVKSSIFDINNSIKLEDIKATDVVDMGVCLESIPKLKFDISYFKFLKNGNKIKYNDLKNEYYRIYNHNNILIGIYKYNAKYRELIPDSILTNLNELVE